MTVYVNYAAILAASVRIPYDERNSPDIAALRKAFEERMDDLDSSDEWHEALDFTDPILEDKHGNPIADEENYPL